MLECAIRQKQVSWSDVETITGIHERDLRDRLENILDRIAPRINDRPLGEPRDNAGLKLASFAIDQEV
jgi:hypothetical protein